MVTLTLKKPIQSGSETVSELKFREDLTAGDVRGIKIGDLANMSTDDYLRVASRLCGQAESAVLNKLSLEDFGEVINLVAGFFNPGQPVTGS